jgi:hypothetical protein
MSKTRAVRLTTEEDKMVQQFLELNPFFDFSTLTRTAILQFIENPKMNLKPVLRAPAKSPLREG